MAAMQAAGYRIRARLSPVVPVRNWREEYASLLETLLRRVRPDVITLELLGWLDFGDLFAIFDRDVLDSALVDAAEAEQERLAGVGWRPFTQAAHEEVYRFCIESARRLSPDTPVAVCHGTPEMWRAPGPMMNMTPGNFVCNCGPMSAPGGSLYGCWHTGR